MRMRLVVAVWMAVAVVAPAVVPAVVAPAVAAPEAPVPTGLGQLSDAFEALAGEIGPAVVQIFAVGFAPGTGPGLSSADLLAKQRGSGSGVILDPEGYVVTNAHVVAGARRIEVLLASAGDAAGSGERSILRAKGPRVGAQVVGLDRETDLAVLRIQARDLAHLELGDSDELRQGQLVLAFGSPLGLENSVSMGVVSSVARQLEPESPMIYIQTDAPINPGNSGGPLVDAAGRVVGINTFILTRGGGSEGLGFAAPSNIVRNVFEQIRASGRVRRGEIGVEAQTITPELAAGLGLAQGWGVILGDVHPGGPAARAGLEVGDIVLSLNGKPMENGRQLEVNLYRYRIGETVTLEVLRGGAPRSFQVAVGERADDAGRFAELVTPERNLVSELGILGLEIDRELAEKIGPLRQRGGVLVAAIAADAPFWEAGFEPGDVIHAVNGRAIRGLAALRTALGALEPGAPVVAQVERGGALRYLAFKLE